MLYDLNVKGIKLGNYKIDEYGNIYSNVFKKFLTPYVMKNGYLQIHLMTDETVRKNFYIHRLIMMQFNPIENMEFMEVNHIDLNKKNNHISNLEWCTHAENMKHRDLNGKSSMVGKIKSEKLSAEQIKEIYIRANNGENMVKLAKEYNISKSYIQGIKQGKRLTHITGSSNNREKVKKKKK